MARWTLENINSNLTMEEKKTSDIIKKISRYTHSHIA
jgi:hypothetical protein